MNVIPVYEVKELRPVSAEMQKLRLATPSQQSILIMNDGDKLFLPYSLDYFKGIETIFNKIKRDYDAV